MPDACLQTIAYKELTPDIGRKGTQMPAEITSRKSQPLYFDCVCLRLYYTASLSLVFVVQVMACR